jgi:catechol 2,3-dioxygenase-like lactoylglutathione lyase family enzyme
MKNGITVLYNPRRTNMATFTLYPLVVLPEGRRFRFTSRLSWVLKHDTNTALLMVGWIKKDKQPSAEDRVVLDQLRAKYRVLAYLDDNDGTEIQQGAFVPWFDLWFKKQLFRDRSLYLKTFEGYRLFTEYYAQKYNVSDDRDLEPITPLRPEDLGKLRLCWNILVGEYPLRPWREKAIALWVRLFGLRAARWFVRQPRYTGRPSPKLNVCHARFGAGAYRPTVGFQRKHFLAAVSGQPGFLAGRVPKKQYDQELKTVQGILSPFGWGEVCYRDSEAVRHGSVLFKPQVDHMETWPDLYRPGETYVPLDWDASDVVSQVAQTLSSSQREALADRAWQVLVEAEAALADRVLSLENEIRSLMS